MGDRYNEANNGFLNVEGQNLEIENTLL